MVDYENSSGGEPFEADSSLLFFRCVQLHTFFNLPLSLECPNLSRLTNLIFIIFLSLFTIPFLRLFPVARGV